jgi:uncharacterized protein with ATP-grasp and redox domains
MTEAEQTDLLNGARIARDNFGMQRLYDGVVDLIMDYKVATAIIVSAAPLPTDATSEDLVKAMVLEHAAKYEAA